MLSGVPGDRSCMLQNSGAFTVEVGHIAAWWHSSIEQLSPISAAIHTAQLVSAHLHSASMGHFQHPKATGGGWLAQSVFYPAWNVQTIVKLLHVHGDSARYMPNGCDAWTQAFKGIKCLFMSTLFSYTNAKGANPLWPAIQYIGVHQCRCLL